MQYYPNQRSVPCFQKGVSKMGVVSEVGVVWCSLTAVLFCCAPPLLHTISDSVLEAVHTGSQTDSGETNKSHNYCLYLFELFDLK